MFIMKCFLINSPINPTMSNNRYNNAAIKIQCFLKNILYQISKFCNWFSGWKFQRNLCQRWKISFPNLGFFKACHLAILTRVVHVIMLVTVEALGFIPALICITPIIATVLKIIIVGIIGPIVNIIWIHFIIIVKWIWTWAKQFLKQNYVFETL